MAAMSFTRPVNMCVFATLECVASGAISLMGRSLGRDDMRSARHIARGGPSLLYAVCLLSLPLVIPSVSNALFSNIGSLVAMTFLSYLPRRIRAEFSAQTRQTT